jgi:hypothetical protein
MDWPMTCAKWPDFGVSLSMAIVHATITKGLVSAARRFEIGKHRLTWEAPELDHIARR